MDPRHFWYIFCWRVDKSWYGHVKLEKDLQTDLEWQGITGSAVCTARGE